MSKPYKPLSFLLCLFLLISFNSCKKDLLTEAKDDSLLPPPSGLTSISFDELQKRIRLSKLGLYSSALANNESKEGKFWLREDLNLLTDKITMISNKGVTSYTMAVEQNSKQKATFQNVTFVERNGNIEAYLLTYRASKAWASRLKIDKKAPFEGYFSYSKLESKKSITSENRIFADGCETFTYYYTVSYRCDGPPYHYSWDTGCPLEGTSRGAWDATYGRSITVCGASGNTWVTGLTGDGSGGGSGGGGTPTYPTLPLNYNPDCDYGYAGVSSLKNSGMTTSAVGDDCPYDDPNPAGLIANINKLTGILGLDWAKQEFLHNMDALQGKTVTRDLLAYLDNNGVSQQNIDFGNWAIGYLTSNPSYDYEVFKNQFLGTSEGSDGVYDASFWEDPNLTFPAQNLPSWASFSAAFPKDSNPLYNTPQKMYSSLGGDIANYYVDETTNTCAIRLSKALNYSGVIIPHINGKTFIGADNKYYFKAAYELNIWMRKTFGTNDGDPTTPYNANHTLYTATDAGINGRNLPGLLFGKKGIYSIYSSNFVWASGHADMLNPNSTCGNNCHFADAPIARLDIWILN